MTSRRTSCLAGVAGLTLLVVGLGCSICCPFVPQPPTITPSLPPPPTGTSTDMSTPEATPTPEPTPTPEVSTMVPYVNPLAGFSILYPADWIYEAGDRDAYFAKTEEALAYSDPVEMPVLAVMAASPEEMELQFGPVATAEDLLDSALESLRGEKGFEIGEVETWAFGEALGEKRGIVRMADVTVPMDEALVMVAVDIGGRGYSVLDLDFSGNDMPGLPGDLIRHFLESFAIEARINLHASIIKGSNDHHKAEALFKALAKALDKATLIDDRISHELPTTKGRLES